MKISRLNSKSFEFGKGLKEDELLQFTVLFNIALEKIIRDSELNRVGKLLNKSHQVMIFADDVEK